MALRMEFYSSKCSVTTSNTFSEILAVFRITIIIITIIMYKMQNRPNSKWKFKEE